MWMVPDASAAGGAGNDRLTGGAGKDSLVFRTGLGHGTVLDFEAGDGIDRSSTDIGDFDSLAKITKDYLSAEHLHFGA